MKRKWHMLCKRRISVFFVAAMALSVISCADEGKEAEELYRVKIESQPTVEPVKTPDLQSAVTPIQTLDKQSDRNQEAETYQMKEWGRAYLEYLDSYDDRDSAKYAFIYVDDDDIPELAVNSGWALNCRVLTFHDNKVNDLETYRFTIRYVEKEGLLVNSGSHMWEGFENFYALRGGQWEQIGSGKSYELGNEGLFFEWEEEKVTEEEYDQRINSIFPVEREKLPAYLYTFDELYFILGGE